jgi:ABC-type uncharacterized transport system substrate-binding protein
MAAPKATLFFFLLFLPAALFAHPHVWISSSCEFLWKGDKLLGVYIDWSFDPAFDAEVVGGRDDLGDGVFDAKETKAVYDRAFINLKNYGFFTFVRQGEKRSSPKSVGEFSVYRKSGTLHYRFFVDLSGYSSPLALAVYDLSYYCAIDYAKENPVTFDCEASLVKPSAEIVEDKAHPVYYDPTDSAGSNAMHYAWKKGLLTFYPKEIRLSWTKVGN